MITCDLGCPWCDYCIHFVARWHPRRWFKKLTDLFWPIRKELESGMYNNTNDYNSVWLWFWCDHIAIVNLMETYFLYFEQSFSLFNLKDFNRFLVVLKATLQLCVFQVFIILFPWGFWLFPFQILPEHPKPIRTSV